MEKLIKLDKLVKAHAALYKQYGTEHFSYCDAALKRGLHKDAAAYMRMLATELGFDRKDYDISSNAGGIAGSGEITLHTDTLYVQLSQWAGSGTDLTFLIRGCLSRKDYSGMVNRSVKLRPSNWTIVLAVCEAAKRQEEPA